MKRVLKNILKTWLSLIILGQPGFLSADYVMMCTFFQNPTAKVFNVSDEGDITWDYDLTVGGYPLSIVFSPDGKWGMVGSDTTAGHPERQITIILSVDEEMQISVLGTVFNDNGPLVEISPDSNYGIYGFDLKSLRFYSDNTYEVIPSSNPQYLGAYDAPFSILSNNIITQSSRGIISEYTLLEDGRTTSTGFSINISPENANSDLEISPDGKTCVILGFGDYGIVTLRIHEQGGFHLAEKFDQFYYYPWQVDFTPDSQLAIVSYCSGEGWDEIGMVSYAINPDSTLTEVDAVDLPYLSGEDMAVTPDGKFAITRTLAGEGSTFFVVRIHEDGSLEYLPEKNLQCSGHVSAIAFVPPRKTAVGNTWLMY